MIAPYTIFLYFRNNNVKNMGGAIHIQNSITCLNIDCQFVNNSASNGGGAIYLIGSASTITNVNCSFLYNIVTKVPGGALLEVYGGGALWIDYGQILNNGSHFIGNRADHGGAIYGDQATCANINSLFIANYASKSGGVMQFENGKSCRNVKCNFTQNVGR